MNTSGRQTIGKLSDIELSIDFSDLFKYRGERQIKNLIEKQLGRIMFLVSFGLLVGPVAFLMLEGSFALNKLIKADSLIYLLPFFSIYGFLYAFYLTRSKDSFNFNLEQNNLRKVIPYLKLHQIKKLEIDNFFDERVLEIIDKSYFEDRTKFINLVSEQLLSDSRNQKLIKTRLGINVQKFTQAVNRFLLTIDTSFEHHFQTFFLNCFKEAFAMEVEKIDSQVLMLIMNKYYWNQVLCDFDVTDLEIEGIKEWYKNELIKLYYQKAWKVLSNLKPTGAINRSFTSRVTPLLDQYGTDFTALAARENFVTVIGKGKLTSDVIRILQKESGSAVLILGEPGVGKTRFLKYLATRMVVEDMPKELQDLRLVVIDLNSVMTKSASVDSFKLNLQKLIEEVVVAKNVILSFEEIGQIFSLREDGRLEVINLIANLIDKYRLKIIGTANIEDYATKIKPVRGFAALFDVVEIPEPDPNLSFQILMDFLPELEREYGVQIRVEAIKRIVKFAPKILYERAMPDKGIDFLEEALLKARSRRLKFLDEQLIDEMLKEKIGVDVGDISDREAKKLEELELEMHKRVVGQDYAVNSIASALRRSRAGMISGKRPVASFLFYGPTGVGKTEVAKTLADLYYGSESLMLRLDMSEYQEEKNLDRLLGYTDENGNFVGGYLTEGIRTRPYSLILLDEIEKANPKVLDIFLQILDDGRLTDGMGRIVDFTNTIIIATSNAASKEIANYIAQGYKYNDVQKLVKPQLNSIFRIEFMNRFDKIIMFKPLNQIEIQQIADILLKKLDKSLEERGMSIAWDQKTLEMLALQGYNPVYGARELRRLVQDVIEDQLANLIITKKLVSGKEVVFSGLNVVEIK